MKTRNSIWSLAAKLGTTKVDGISLQSLGAASTAGGDSAAVTSRLQKATRGNDLKGAALSGGKFPAGIQFGSPSSSPAKSTQPASPWTNLLKRAGSGSISSALGGGVLSAIGGIGGIISGIASLFEGGKETLPPLVRFSLPSSQSRTVYVSGGGSSNYSGVTTEQSSRQAPAGGTYLSSSSAGSVSQEHIVSAVKQALLNSSSLNDVIAEI